MLTMRDAAGMTPMPAAGCENNLRPRDLPRCCFVLAQALTLRHGPNTLHHSTFAASARACSASHRPPADRRRTGSPRQCRNAEPGRSEAFEHDFAEHQADHARPQLARLSGLWHLVFHCSHLADQTRNTPVHRIDKHTSKGMARTHWLAGSNVGLERRDEVGEASFGTSARRTG